MLFLDLMFGCLKFGVIAFTGTYSCEILLWLDMILSILQSELHASSRDINFIRNVIESKKLQFALIPLIEVETYTSSEIIYL
jgi:hypothetical protein